MGNMYRVNKPMYIAFIDLRNAFESWYRRRTLQIPWTDIVKKWRSIPKNERTKSNIENNQGKEKKRIGHIIRNNEWITKIIEGKIDGNVGRGRPRKPLMKQIIKDREKTNYKELKVVAKMVEIHWSHWSI